MLAVQAHCHQGHIHLTDESLPRDAKVVVVFLDAEPANAPNGLSPEQNAALHLQSQSCFAQTVLLNRIEECWNDA